jgi:cell division protein FtsI (penicillin-binding protein 3)
MLKKSYRVWLYLLAGIFFGLFVAVEVRLYYLQVTRYVHYSLRANEQQIKSVTVTPKRGDILDRNLKPLATSTRAYALYADQALTTKDPDLLARRLARLLSLPRQKVLSYLTSSSRAPLARKIPEEMVGEIQSLAQEFHLPKQALDLRKESKRAYPRGRLASAVLGYVAIDDSGDNVGIAGLEKCYDGWIKGEYREAKIERSPIYRQLMPFEEETLYHSFGCDLVLTLDSTIQYIAERELRSTIEQFEADSGVALVMSTKTGEIVAMASFPDFDPGSFSSSPLEHHRNRCITDPIEPGSVMKIFTVATLLDLDLLSPDEPIDCENGSARVEGRRVTDAGGHKLGVVPYKEAFYWSSNIGTCKVGLRIEPATYYERLTRFGFGQKTGIDLPNEDTGLLRPVTQWTKLSRTSLPIGYELNATAVQIAAGASAIGNQGMLMRPYVVQEIRDSNGDVVKRIEPRGVRRVISRATAAKMLDLMKGVYLAGTGKNAQIQGYVCAVKTGTTRKSQIRDRAEYISSFVGLVPGEDPQITIYVYIDNPKGKFYAADVAAPLFKNIAEGVLPCLAIPPTIEVPEENLVAGARANEGARKDSVDFQPLAETTEPDSESSVVGEGVMPDLRGLTMRAVQEKLADLDLDVRFIGSGVVVEQSPKAFEKIDRTKQCMVIFGNPTLEVSDVANRK